MEAIEHPSIIPSVTSAPPAATLPSAARYRGLRSHTLDEAKAAFRAAWEAVG